MNILKHALEIHKKSYNYFTKQIYANVYVCIIKLPATLQYCTIITVNKILYILLYMIIL